MSATRQDYARMGAKGGRARAAVLTPTERSAIARTASTARWAKARQPVPVVVMIVSMPPRPATQCATMTAVYSTTPLVVIRASTGQAQPPAVPPEGTP